MVNMYDKLAKTNKERDIEISEDGNKEGQPTLSDKEENYEDMSDLQSALTKLFPASLGNNITNKVMVGRISPDVFMELLYLMTESDIFNSAQDEEIDVAQAVIKNYTLLSIGLDGKGRIDQIELAGASKSVEEEMHGLGNFR